MIWICFAGYLISAFSFLASLTVKSSSRTTHDVVVLNQLWPREFHFVGAIIPILFVFIFWILATLILLENPSNLFIGVS
jgi:hypothetical protein